jgi:hypothetical protein
MGAKEGSKQERDKCERMTRYKRATGQREKANGKVGSEKKEADRGMSKWEMSEGKEKRD